MAATNATIYDLGLDKNAANHAPLTPLTLLAWSAEVYPDRLAVVHGARRFTWRRRISARARLGSALAARGIGVGDTVAAMLSNTPEMYEAHFGVPMTRRACSTRSTRGSMPTRSRSCSSTARPRCCSPTASSRRRSRPRSRSSSTSRS